MAMQMAYDKLRAEVARWEFPYLEFDVTLEAESGPGFGEMVLFVKARRGANVVQQYVITVMTVLKAEFLALVVQDILDDMVRSWAKSWLKRTEETTPPVRENEGKELEHPIVICSVCKKLDGICECKPKPLRWEILQPEYH